ncbi:MAG: hypothetical protein JF614_27535 [Acidobacteria bacterium]|nr:hypothetical protein [Acidobacteriota bacterium]
MRKDVRIRLRLLVIPALLAGAVLVPSLNAASRPPVCWYDVSCVHDCSLACGGNSACQTDCNETYCKVCP